MLTAIIRFALLHRGLTVVAMLVVLGYGSYLSMRMPIDVFPDLDRPRVVLLTECPGLPPSEVESQVTQPIETAMLGAPGVEAVRSQSSNGLVVTYVEFEWRTEIRSARQVVSERLSGVAGLLPPNIRPVMTPPASIMGQIMHVAIYRDQPTSNPARDRMELRTLADWVVRPRLLKEAGIAEVIVMGGDRKQYQILVDPEKLFEFGISLQEVELAVKESNLSASGGFTEEGQIERPIRVIARLGPEPEKVLDDLRKVPVRTLGTRSVLLSQVAKIVEGPAPKRGDGGIDGHDGVILTIVKQPHADTLAVTERVKSALAGLQPSLPKGVSINAELFQLKSFIDRGIYYVGEALVIGAVLVVLILFLFLFNLRTTFITLTAIPLSLVTTALVFRIISYLTGTELSINVMTLGGIAVAMGELVDDAIVDVENIHRRLGENARVQCTPHAPREGSDTGFLPSPGLQPHAEREEYTKTPKSSLRVIFDASLEIRSAIVFGTAVVILAFLPLFALSGVEGRLFAPLGLAYIISILASLMVSLTVTPVLAYYLLSGEHQGEKRKPRDAILVRLLKWCVSYLIRFSMKFGGVLLVFTWILVVLAGWKFTQLGRDFLPKFDEGSIQINVTLPTGSSLRASNEIAEFIDQKLRTMQQSPANPEGEIRFFIRRTGRAELDEHAEPVSRSEYILTMNPNLTRGREEMLALLLKELREDVPGVEFEAEQPLSHLISHMLSGVTAQIAIKIYGDDLDKLQKIAQQIKSTISDIRGLNPPVIDPQEIVDELHIIPRAEDLAFYGISRTQVAEFVQTALKGEAISFVLEGQRRFELVVKLQDLQRTDYRKLHELRLTLPNGRGQIRLGDVADIPDGAGGPNQVNRENVRRRAVIRCNVSKRDLGSVVSQIEKRVRDNVPLPEGYFVEYGGQFEAQRSATALILILSLVSFASIFAVLYLLYPSVPISLQILNAIPTAFIGGVLALVITRQTVTVASLVGFVSLGGIAVRNGILLVSHYFHLMKHEGEPFSQSMILRGSLERLSPVLMTALTAGIGLLPIVLGGQKPGLEILYPVATVILGGLITSTFCEFLIHPGIFWKFSGSDADALAHAESSEAELLR